MVNVNLQCEKCVVIFPSQNDMESNALDEATRGRAKTTDIVRRYAPSILNDYESTPISSVLLRASQAAVEKSRCGFIVSALYALTGINQARDKT